jgi:hypothetical protein
MGDLSKRIHWLAQILTDLSAITLHLHFLALLIINTTRTPKTSTALNRTYKMLEVLAGLMTPLAKR